jgi:hypothetical protein
MGDLLCSNSAVERINRRKRMKLIEEIASDGCSVAAGCPMIGRCSGWCVALQSSRTECAGAAQPGTRAGSHGEVVVQFRQFD